MCNYLCENNAVTQNPVHGVKRPSEGANEGKTPAISDEQARQLLEAPSVKTLKGLRDRAILSVFLFHGLRCEELSTLKVEDMQARRGIMHFCVHGKGGKIRFIPAHPASIARIEDYLERAGHREDAEGALFRPVRNNTSGTLNKAIHPSSLYHNVVRHYARLVGIAVRGFCIHSLRATAATNALEHEADIAKVQEWLGHSNISTTRLYDRRQSKPEESPTFQVRY